ncbi:hypothetical protein [Paenibacillus xylanilyticus]|uniref:Uncharacterized protein n=1 Tax=Paenibacillus xylanilyticus TaxID=248903 RepID=A0A7Y6BX44_9BACL|nr:hypothetical protein [Paenibacillus xylanilyticus]NUU75740.1 hypothetical protein [Paenibacillus xylanilyticus]
MFKFRLKKRNQYGWDAISAIVPGMPTLKLSYWVKNKEVCSYISKESQITNEVLKASHEADQNTEIQIWRRIGSDMSEDSWSILCLAAAVDRRTRVVTFISTCYKHLQHASELASKLWKKSKAKLIRAICPDNLFLAHQICMAKYNLSQNSFSMVGEVSEEYGKIIFATQTKRTGNLVEKRIYFVGLMDVIQFNGLLASLLTILGVGTRKS